jgi:hypothetical protein
MRLADADSIVPPQLLAALDYQSIIRKGKSNNVAYSGIVWLYF